MNNPNSLKKATCQGMNFKARFNFVRVTCLDVNMMKGTTRLHAALVHCLNMLRKQNI
jgi:hypothetical protein